jgi:hypothetical protein
MRLLLFIRRSCARLACPLLVATIASPLGLHAATATITQTLQANIAAEAAFSTTSYNFTLAKTGTIFNSFTGSLQLLFRARTGSSATAAGITMKATSDFTPSGGPSIASPPTVGAALQYSCSGATLGSNCTGTQTVSTSASTPVITLPRSACTGGGAPCSADDPNSMTLNFTLTNDPKYKAGNYTATLTFTISAI